MKRNDIDSLSEIYDGILLENIFDQQASKHKSDTSNKFSQVAGHIIELDHDVSEGIKDEHIISTIQRSIDTETKNSQKQINLKILLDHPSVSKKFVDLVKYYVVRANESGNVTRPDLIKIDLRKVSYDLGSDEIVKGISNFINAVKSGRTHWKSGY